MSFNILFMIVVLNVIATITLWQTAARRPEKVKKKLFAALMDNKPIVPKHQRPKSIGEGWGVYDQDRKFFADFEDFADVVNWWFATADIGGPWRLQELADTELRLGCHDSPTYGRRYEIYHNQVRAGSLELQASYQDGESYRKHQDRVAPPADCNHHPRPARHHRLAHLQSCTDERRVSTGAGGDHESDRPATLILISDRTRV